MYQRALDDRIDVRFEQLSKRILQASRTPPKTLVESGVG